MLVMPNLRTEYKYRQESANPSPPPRGPLKGPGGAPTTPKRVDETNKHNMSVV